MDNKLRLEISTNQLDLIAMELVKKSMDGKSFDNYDQMVDTYVKRYIMARKDVSQAMIRVLSYRSEE